MSHWNIDIITQSGESKNKKNCKKFEKLYFAGRVLLALINVLTHSAVGGEPEEKIFFSSILLHKDWDHALDMTITPTLKIPKEEGLFLTCNPADKSIENFLECSHNCQHTWSKRCWIEKIVDHFQKLKIFCKKKRHLPGSWHSSISVQLLRSDSNLFKDLLF